MRIVERRRTVEILGPGPGKAEASAIRATLIYPVGGGELKVDWHPTPSARLSWSAQQLRLLGDALQELADYMER
jgi:hypothetical protein